MPAIEFWYEFASTYSYPAAMRIEAEARGRGLDVNWRPFLLGPIFGDFGWNDSPFNLQPIKGRYMWRDLERTCASLAIPFKPPTPFPQNGLQAARIALALPDDGTRANFSRAVYAAEFGAGRSINDASLLRDLLAGVTAQTDDAIKRAGSDENKAEMRAQIDTARTHGIFGAPAFITSDKELFWGNDRVEQALEWQAGLNNR